MQYYNTKPIRTTNREARNYVINGVPFTNSNGQLFGRWETPSLYVVYSYGEHWPLFIWSERTETWYENEDKYSVTTSRHHTHAHPHRETERISRAKMREIIDAHWRVRNRELMEARQAAALSEVQTTLGLAA